MRDAVSVNPSLTQSARFEFVFEDVTSEALDATDVADGPLAYRRL